MTLPVKAKNDRTSRSPVGLGKQAILLGTGFFLIAAFSANGFAKGKPDPGGPGLQLIISEVFLTDPFDLDDDPDNQLMDIFGADFDPGDDPLVVTLGMWDLTDDCALIGLDFDHIRCDLPPDGVGVAGDYLVKVSHGLGQSEGDEYDLTIAEPPVPEGTIAFYAATACPPGWDEYTAARGLAIVGLPAGGTVEGGFGNAMGDNEDRTGHTHDVDPAAVDSSTAGAHDHTGSTNPGGNHTHTIGATDDFSGSGKAVECGSDLDNPSEIADPCFTFNDYLFVPAYGHVHPVGEAGLHDHTVAQDGDHNHSVDVGNTTSTTPSNVPNNEDVLPYIQLLACVKGCISDCDAE